jgi:hypothetical protein
VRQAARLLLAPQRYSARWAAERWAGAVVANGGTVSDARLDLITALIDASMVCGHWWAVDDIALLTAENEAQALTTLKRTRLMIAANAPTFTADAGYAFNGTTQYINTGFIPSRDAVQMKPANIRLSAYERTNVSTNTSVMGNTGNGQTYLRPRSTNSLQARLLTAAITFADSVTDSRGYSVVATVNNSPSARNWKNGVAGTSATSAANATILPVTSLFIGGANNSGSVAGPRASTVGYVDWGAPLPNGTPAELAWYTALQAYMTAIGAQV